jgi:hypothetical protein
MANETHNPLVTLPTLFKTFSYVCVAAQWPYSTGKLRIATIMMKVTFLPPDCVTRVSGQDSQQQRTRGLTKISQHQTPPSTPTSKLSVGLK